MAIYITSNVASIDAQRNLANTQVNLQKNLSHLSSGLRINSAADDAAGLSISTEFRAQISSFDQATRNANDGISLVQTADGALNQVSGILNRGRQLAVQSANGTLSAGDRTYINQEFTALKSEIDRISSVTKFNGNNLLDGSVRSVALQVGTGTTANDQVAVNLFGAQEATGNVTFATKATSLGADTALAFTVGGSTITKNYTAASDTLQTVIDSINSDTTLKSFGILASAKASGGNFVLEVTGHDSFTKVADSGASLTTAPITTAFNTAAGLTSATTAGIGFDSAKGTYLGNASLDTAANATNALTNIDAAISDVSGIRATLGVSQNRLQFAIDNNASTQQNFSAADARIEDVDVAAESASMTRNNILSQAGVSILAQANQLPQAALSLLGH